MKIKRSNIIFSIRYAKEEDKDFWFTLDRELGEREFLLKVRDKQAYIILNDNNPIGIMRYNFIWDIIPFLTLIIIEDNYHRQGYGRKALEFWEEEIKELGYKLVMTSTRVDEYAQYFYRKLGYIDRGSLFLDRKSTRLNSSH